MSDNENTVPYIGMGVTHSVGSDSYPYTVVEIRNARTLVVQADRARRTDDNGLSERQSYLYEVDPRGQRVVITQRKNGLWFERGKDHCVFWLGRRNAYSDPSF